MERKEWDGEYGNETIDAGTLIRSEDFPPTDGAVSEDHCYI